MVLYSGPGPGPASLCPAVRFGSVFSRARQAAAPHNVCVCVCGGGVSQHTGAKSSHGLLCKPMVRQRASESPDTCVCVCVCVCGW